MVKICNEKGINIKLMSTIVVALSAILLMTVGVCRAQNTEIQVNEIQYNNSQILSEEEIAEITADYEDRAVTVAELKELVARINEIYSNRGYITARALLPAQTVADGIVKIELVEGTIDQILVEGNSDTRDSYILKRISYGSGDIIKTDILEEELFYFNATGDIMLQAELKPGQDYGTTDLKLNVREPKKYQISLFTDNAGRDETGVYRCGINALVRSLRGYRDSLNISYFSAEGAQGGSLSYSTPVAKDGTRLIFSYNNNVTDIISGEYESVNIEGDYEDYGIGFRRPFMVRDGFKLDGSLEYRKKTSDTYFSGVSLLSSEIETYNIGLSTQSMTKRTTWNNSYNILLGSASAGKDDYDDPGTVGDFIKYNINFINQSLLEKENTFDFKCYLQGTNDKLLPSSEQLSLGGMSTVRGYEEGKQTGDYGYFVSTELSKAVSEKTKYFLFVEHGGVFPFKGNEEPVDQKNYLTSFGSGYTINFTETISGEFTVGIPLINYEEPRLHFSLEKTF